MERNQPPRVRGNNVSSSGSRSVSRQYVTGARGTNTESSSFFTNCISEVQRNLKAAGNAPSLMHTLAGYYTRVEPFVEGRPFCVSLSFATFLFHMQMARISVSDTELYIQLVSTVLLQITGDERLTHPFVKMVVHDRIFGLPSPTCGGAPHCVVLIQPQQFRAFRTMAAGLLAMEVVPIDIVYQFHEKLTQLCKAASPMVSNRALALLIETVKHVRLDEQASALHLVLQSKPLRMNVDFILACYERLKRIAMDPGGGPGFVGALCIHCSEIFLRFRSPIRRDYVERFLYPALCRVDMAPFLSIPETRRHLLCQLLRQCNPGLSVFNPYYLCICAIMQRSFDDEINGALETVDLVNTHMPHAAFFMSALAVDSRMSISVFAKVIIALSRGAGLAMGGWESKDEVASSISDNASSVYNVLYTLREVVRCCSTTSSRRSSDMLKALRVAMPPASIEALAKLALDAFDNSDETVVDPQLLCAEVAMVLHHQHLEDALNASLEYFRHATRQCPSCGMQNTVSLICPVTHEVHVPGHLSAGRVLITLSECAGMKKLQDTLIQYLQNSATQLDRAVHALIYYIISHAGPHRLSVFKAVEPYIRGTLLAIVDDDFTAFNGRRISSEQRANILMLHVKIITLLSGSIEASYFESTLKVFSEMSIRNNHDALCAWYMGNILIRQSGPNLELLPTDPLENNYCTDYPACAPSSHTCAVNAQLVLKLLDHAHNFSAETRKLVGCCVCRLIQDFNMQAPNIIGTLLSSFGFFLPQLTSLSPFALPLGENTAFWTFFLHQMRTSPPAGTALMVAIAKCIGRRFRIENPSSAVPLKMEETSHLFAVMLYETMKRSPSISRVILCMASQWMKQRGNTPGKFACLLYVCTQLVFVVENRLDGPAGVEQEAETDNDRRLFRDSVEKTVRTIQKMRPRLGKLMSVCSRENVPFFYFLRRLDRKVTYIVSKVDGEDSPDDLEDDGDWANMGFDQPASTTHEGGRDAGDYPMDEFRNAGRNDTNPHTPTELSSGVVQHISTSAVEAAPYMTTATHSDSSDGATGGERDDVVERRVREGAGSGNNNEEDGNIEGLSSIRMDSISARAVSQSTADKAVTAPFEKNIGTSPIHQESNEEMPHQAGTPVQGLRLAHVGTDVSPPSWNEPSLWSDVSPEGNKNTEQTEKDENAPPGLGTQIPSAMVLEYLRTHQGMDSIRDEIAQLENPGMNDAARFGAQMVADYTPSIPVTVHNAPNNYDEPHGKSSVVPQQSTIITPVQMVNVRNPAPHPHSGGMLAEAERFSGIVDGETPLLPVSEEVSDVKRQRLDGLAAPVPHTAAHGMQFFLQQQAQQRQAALRAAKGKGNTDSTNTEKNVEADGIPTTALPFRNIPACLVEQKSDSVIHELRQAMGSQNPNTSGAEGPEFGLKLRRRSKGTTERSSSTAWWAETTTAPPNPSYAADPQYSMELF